MDKAEKFLIETMAKRHPEIPRSSLMKWAMNYNLEKEKEDLFNSEDYPNEEARAIAMFPEMPLAELQAVSVNFYKHNKTDHGGDHEKRIKELEEQITDPELVGIAAQKWWLD